MTIVRTSPSRADLVHAVEMAAWLARQSCASHHDPLLDLLEPELKAIAAAARDDDRCAGPDGTALADAIDALLARARNGKR